MPKVKTFLKKDANTLEITETTTTDVISTYTYDDLINKKDQLVAEKAELIVKKDAEIAEIDALILAADGLGIVALPPA